MNQFAMIFFWCLDFFYGFMPNLCQKMNFNLTGGNMKLLLGVYGMQEGCREIVKMANEMGADIKSYALRIGKIAVERYLQQTQILLL